MNRRLGRLATGALALLLAWSAGGAAERSGKPKEVRVKVRVGIAWAPLPETTAAVGEARVVTHSMLQVRRALHPATGEPYVPLDHALTCEPADLHRSFRTEKTHFLLGEPILVELRVELEGPGQWAEPIGGCYRARGRDDNFLFLLRRDDGTWVPDPYGPITVYMGGIASTHTIARGEPRSCWLPVQRWCALDQPGTYDLFCFHTAHGHENVGYPKAYNDGLPADVRKTHRYEHGEGLIDEATGKRSERYSLTGLIVTEGEKVSPLLDRVPKDAAAEARRRHWMLEHVADFAQVRIVVRQGTDDERQQMVEEWMSFAGPTRQQAGRPHGRWSAARRAICFAQQDDFLPLLEQWAPARHFSLQGLFAGLAMRPSPDATRLLFRLETPRALGGLHYLHRSRIPDAIPRLIDRLGHAEPETRAWAAHHLNRWTGQAFLRDWQGYNSKRPTPDEGRRMQPLWRQWWAEHKDGFEPVHDKPEPG